MDKVVHFELPVDDFERAQKFYKTVFGWKMESLPEMEYILIETTPVDEAPSHSLSYHNQRRGYKRCHEKHQENGRGNGQGKNTGKDCFRPTLASGSMWE